MMEGALLTVLGRPSTPQMVHPAITLSALDKCIAFLQANAVEKYTLLHYSTGTHDYISFCINHHLPLDPTPQTLAWYIAYTLQFISSGPKYLSGTRHFLHDLYPDFDTNRAHPSVQATITGSRKIHADPVHHKLPLCMSHLATFLHMAVVLKDFDDLLFATMLSCMFYACHCSGELVIKNDHHLFDWRKIIKCSAVNLPCIVPPTIP